MDPSRAGRAAAPIFTPRQRSLVLFGFALLVILRLPQAWLHGRFLTEEGPIFFAYAWRYPWAEALWRPFGGYLNLGATAPTLLAARLVQWGALPLELAPRVTMLTALGAQLLPAALILGGRADWLTSRRAVLGSLLILVASPMTEEVFANSLHIQFHLVLAAALLLALDAPRTRLGAAGACLLLFLAPLCGPLALILLPLFALRAWADRALGRLLQFVALAAGGAVQLAFFLSASAAHGVLLDPATLGAVLFVRLAALPYASHWLANALGRMVASSQQAGGIGWWFAAAGGAAYVAALAGLAWRRRGGAAAWLIGVGLVFAIVSFGGAMTATDPRKWFSVGSGQAQNFLPLVLIGLGLLAAARDSLVCLVAVALTLISGTISYARPIRELARGPVWRDEVAAWRADPGHPLATWPARWRVDLTSASRPCAPPSPRYCEEAWLARVRADAVSGRRTDPPAAR